MRAYKIGKIYLDSLGATNLIITSKGNYTLYWWYSQNISICGNNRLFVFHEDTLKQFNPKVVEYARV